jgi:glutamyl-tRNA synthetase
VINAIIKDVNALLPGEQRKRVEREWPELLVEEKGRRETKHLPPLPNVDKYPLVHVRFSPNPDGALHLGGSRAAILCDEYAKMYNGRFTLRFDDSDPRKDDLRIVMKDLGFDFDEIHHEVLTHFRDDKVIGNSWQIGMGANRPKYWLPF